jgi:N4-gp56 family major capsid protein
MNNVYGDLTPRQGVYAEKVFLTRGQPILVTDSIGVGKPIPRNASKVGKWRRWDRLGAKTTALTEGVTPSGQALIFTDYTATLAQYGNHVPIPDTVLDTHEDFPHALRDIMANLGEQAAETIETVRMTVLQAGSGVFYQNGSARTDVNTAMTRATQRNIVSTLRANLAMEFTNVQKSGPDEGNVSIEPAFIGIAHTDVESSIRDLPGFKNRSDYAAQAFHPAELGAVERVRWLLTTLCAPDTDGGGAAGSMKSTSGTDADVYLSIVLGKEAFGIVPLKGQGSVTPTWVNPKVSESDPLAQRGRAGWKTYQTSVRINEDWIQRWEHAVAA